MPPRKKAATKVAEKPQADPQDQPQPGDPDLPPAATLRGQDERGNVRPADNRYLTDEEIEQRDAYVEEKTGDQAQQLIVKREAPEHVEALNSRERE